MLRVGLTGGIACGKTRVLRRLASRGLRTLDLDAVAHAVMAPGRPAFAEVVAAFGKDIVGADGSVDRKALGARVFADSTARERLNAIVHPRVRAEAMGAYMGYGRYLVELMRLPSRPAEEVGGLVPDMDVDEVRRLWREAPGGGIISTQELLRTLARLTEP